MTRPIDTHLLTATIKMAGEDEEETKALFSMLDRARRYLSSFDWCSPISEEYLGFGVGNILALFLFRLEQPINDTDEWLWVVEGDLPSAYFVIDDSWEVVSALNTYCDLMEHWVDAVVSGSPLNDVFPVNVSPTSENAGMLRSRIEFIRNRIIPDV